ncbi:esterase/lipase family protein [Arenicella xantha]|uniref:Triacylglycerol esterase/lipase EstA (Alpha/beta hydrolase family) n=1 Tax=Arenicella xantha TaxID=644221 RepID=A0A395JHI0_9GAMM|nr:alpha/beta fold hydrolase [Arenicella xantha]RBP49366.1 triacylglycerol esterase/lipase EstA (alpha/beta hydrolase family) [Arenicella xantha]
MLNVNSKHKITTRLSLIGVRSIGLIVLLSTQLSACTYLKYSSVQAKYARIQSTDPSQKNLKHMLDRDTFFVIGQTVDADGAYANVATAVAAFSDRFTPNERVDTMFAHGTGRHFGLNLPAGQFVLQVYADVNGDATFDSAEVVGETVIELSLARYPDLVVGQVEIDVGEPRTSNRMDRLPILESEKSQQSLYFPSGTIRQLADPVFDSNMSTLGMYDPASFFEHAPTMFYALEEDEVHKIPVVFVHGIGGSARSFKPIVDRLDRDRYRPWFFYYPSGGDLHQLAGFFYSLFLSGEVIPLDDMPMIVVAHSMGGIVVREALNSYQDKRGENRVELFVSIASPLGGHPSAPSGDGGGALVLPAWRDLNPNSQFIRELYRKPLPSFVNHQLFYAYRNSETLKYGENSDGVVPLSSQLRPEAQQQASQMFGFDNGHVDILSDERMISRLFDEMDKVDGLFSAESMAVLADGGLDVPLADTYSPDTQHLIGYAGKYLVLLVHDRIAPLLQQQDFIQAVQGKVTPTTHVQREFIRFLAEYPEIVDQVLQSHATSNPIEPRTLD